MTHTHTLDAYGDPAPVELYRTADGGLVDTYGDAPPEELFEVVCDDVSCPDAELSPPKNRRDYVRDYNNGWQASRRVGQTGQPSAAFDSGRTSDAWDDGYLDYAADRPKWHLAWCPDHNQCP